MSRRRSRARRALCCRLAVAIAGLAVAGGCRSFGVRPGLVVQGHQVAHERRETPSSGRRAPSNADRAGPVGSPPSSLQRNAEIAAAVILWLVSGGAVSLTLDGAFEENDLLFGASSRPGPDAEEDREEEERRAEEPEREPLPEWLVGPQPQ